MEEMGRYRFPLPSEPIIQFSRPTQFVARQIAPCKQQGRNYGITIDGWIFELVLGAQGGKLAGAPFKNFCLGAFPGNAVTGLPEGEPAADPALLVGRRSG